MPRNAGILLVDDDERNLLALSEVLSSVARVDTASSGKDALRLLLKQEYAVILLDVFMPEMDGYETAALIREREQTARIPIIFLSAVNKETEHLMRGYEMGAVDYVFKPVDPLVLKSKVSVFVDLYRMRRQVEEQALAEQALREANYREQLSRAAAERQLEQVERRQSTILRSLPMAIYEMVPGGLRQIVGGDLGHFMESEAAVGAWEDRVHEDDRDSLNPSNRADRDFVTSEYRWIDSAGVTRHILDQRVAIPGDDGERWAGTLLDISERKQLEARLVHSGKLDALGQLTGGVAHDFNNLLAAVMGGIELLRKRVEFGEREIKVIDQMQHASQRGADLVRRMMAFARTQDLIPTSVDPQALCDSVAGLVDHTLGGKVKVEWNCPERDYYLFVDRTQLELALMNLIINARDAMPEGGTINVSIGQATGRTNDAFLAITVADEGIGMAPEVLARITEPFFTTKETGKGTGLGLSMVAGFAHQSGGELEIESEPGKGTSVVMILPATGQENETEPLADPGTLRWLEGKRMLLVDDDDAVRIVLAEHFRDAGAEVHDFANGDAAIAAVVEASTPYDFVLSDFAMPGIDGVKTLRQIRDLSPASALAVMTGYADDVEIRAADSFSIVHKPVDLTRLAAAFSSSLN